MPRVMCTESQVVAKVLVAVLVALTAMAVLTELGIEAEERVEAAPLVTASMKWHLLLRPCRWHLRPLSS